MKGILEQIAESRLKLTLIGLFSSLGCFMTALMFLSVLTIFFVFIPLMFDNALADSDSKLTDLQEKLDSRLELVQLVITGIHPKSDLEIDGVAIGATVQITTTYKNSLQVEFLEEGADIKTDTRFPGYGLLYEMAEGMIATRVEITCEETGVPEGETPNSYRTSYIEELVGIDGNEKAICKSGFSQVDETKTKVISLEKYEKVYLPTYFSKPEIFGLDVVEDKTKIDGYINEVKTIYDNYYALIYNQIPDSEFSIEGYEYIDTMAIIVDGATLPLNLGISPYGATMTSKFGYRIHPKLKIWKFHTGVDLDCVGGEGIHSMFDGKVIYSGYNGSYGNFVSVAHDTDGDGKTDTLTRYAHMDSLKVSKGATIESGTTVGYCGTTGMSTGTHLHFEMVLPNYNESTCKEPLYWGSSKCFKNPTATLEEIGSKTLN